MYITLLGPPEALSLRASGEWLELVDGVQCSFGKLGPWVRCLAPFVWPDGMLFGGDPKAPILIRLQGEGRTALQSNLYPQPYRTVTINLPAAVFTTQTDASQVNLTYRRPVSQTRVDFDAANLR